MEFLQNLNFLHGADYNPDQWLSHPEVLAKDLELMKKANVNCVSLGMFAWATLEPSEGNYQLEWMGEIIENLYQNGVYTMLATPSGAKPNWLAHTYEEVRRVNRDNRRELQGRRHNHCYTSPVYREKVSALNAKLAEAFGDHPGVILWHLSNEYGGECYCPLCAEAFRGWLREKYVTLENLNDQWWAHFWSHTYTDWNHIEPPMPLGENGIHGLNLDWKRFVTYQTIDFMKTEIAALRLYDKTTPVATNFMLFFDGLNYNEFADHVDIIAWDSYPLWHSETEDIRVASYIAMCHDLMRSIKKQPFLLMESTPSITNWQPISHLKRPGMHMLSSLQAVAHGANSVQYFQWRKSRGSSEKFHGAVVDHTGRDDTRVFGDVAALGERLTNLKGADKSNVVSKVAIIFDQENRWAIADSKGPRNQGIDYLETVFEHYNFFWERGINVDIIDMTADLSDYKLIVAPMLYLYRAGIEEKLKSFVAKGGQLVGTYWSGLVNENDLCFLEEWPGGGMSEVFGLRSEEIDSLYDHQSNQIRLTNTPHKEYTVTHLCDILETKTAETLAIYTTDFYKGRSALTRNSFGDGFAYYIAARADTDFINDFYTTIAKELSLYPEIVYSLPTGVTVSKRVGEDSNYWFFQNYNAYTVSVPVRSSSTLINLESGEKTEELSLSSYEVVVLEERF